MGCIWLTTCLVGDAVRWRTLARGVTYALVFGALYTAGLPLAFGPLAGVGLGLLLGLEYGLQRGETVSLAFAVIRGGVLGVAGGLLYGELFGEIFGIATAAGLVLFTACASRSRATTRSPAAARGSAWPRSERRRYASRRSVSPP